MGMKETKKMLEIIEKQYREANNNYNKEVKKQIKKERISKIVLVIMLLVTMILFVTVR